MYFYEEKIVIVLFSLCADLDRIEEQFPRRRRLLWKTVGVKIVALPVEPKQLIDRSEVRCEVLLLTHQAISLIL